MFWKLSESRSNSVKFCISTMYKSEMNAGNRVSFRRNQHYKPYSLKLCLKYKPYLLSNWCTYSLTQSLNFLFSDQSRVNYQFLLENPNQLNIPSIFCNFPAAATDNETINTTKSESRFSKLDMGRTSQTEFQYRISCNIIFSSQQISIISHTIYFAGNG